LLSLRQWLLLSRLAIKKHSPPPEASQRKSVVSRSTTGDAVQFPTVLHVPHERASFMIKSSWRRSVLHNGTIVPFKILLCILFVNSSCVFLKRYGKGVWKDEWKKKIAIAKAGFFGNFPA